MNFFVIFALLVISIHAAVDFEAWENYKVYTQIHKKLYQTAQEDQKRFNIFKENVKLIKEHNEKYKQGLTTYTMAVNQFADMTPEEFVAGLTLQKVQRPEATSVFKKLHNIQLEEQVNWVQLGAVTGVKDQGQCGSCWAFSTTGSLEGQIFLNNNSLISLSEQNLVDCSTDNSGCNGGLMSLAFDYIEKNGITTEKEYPYTAVDERCQIQAGQPLIKVHGYEEIREDDEDDLIAAIATKGPIAVAIDASYLSFYDSGIYDDYWCSKWGLNHGVLAAGYTRNSILVKNSWGTNWGENGYVRFARGKNLCGIASEASYPLL